MFQDAFNHPTVKKQVRLLKAKYQKTSALVRELELPNQDDIQKSINDGHFIAHRNLINSIKPEDLVEVKKEVAVKEEPVTVEPPATNGIKTKPGKGGKKKADDLM